MFEEKCLFVHPGHLSAATLQVIERRDRGVKGSAFFRGGDSMIPMMRTVNFCLTGFARDYATDFIRIEEAMPLDLLFLHQLALANEYEELAITPTVDRDTRLPWYGDTNKIDDIGDLLRGIDLRMARRKTRHLDEAGQIVAVGPTQIRTGKVKLKMEWRDAEMDEAQCHEEEAAPAF